MLIYGRNGSRNVLDNPNLVKHIYLEEGFSDREILSKVKNYPYSYFSKKDKRFSNFSHQGIVIEVPDYKYSTLDEVFSSDSDILVLDHIEDPHNLGAIIRSAEASGFKSIIIPKERAAQVNSTVFKTSAGTIYSVNIVQVANISDTLRKIKQHNYWVVATSLDAKTSYMDLDYNFKVCLVIGNEAKGVAPIVLKESDYIVKIPMKGTVNSLNASVAAAIMMFEVTRYRS